MFLGSPLVKQQTDFTTATTVEILSNSSTTPPTPLQAIPGKWSMQLSGLNSSGVATPASAWDCLAQISDDGINWQTLFEHKVNINADGSMIFSGGNYYCANYVRLNMVSLTLGSAAKIRVSLLGVF